MLFYAPGAAKKKDGEAFRLTRPWSGVYSSGDTMYSMEPLAQLGDASPAPIYVTGAQGDGLKEWVPYANQAYFAAAATMDLKVGTYPNCKYILSRADGSSGLKLDAWEVFGVLLDPPPDITDWELVAKATGQFGFTMGLMCFGFLEAFCC